MKFQLVLFFIVSFCLGHGQVTLDANGSGNTYSLITSVLAPGHNPIEVPDCNHTSFGDHIDEIFDNELGIHVFRFFIHVTPDNDRCINFDRQRNEIKSYDKSPDNLLGINGETVAYSWKFKIPSGFQVSPNFTHLHQLKSVGGSLASMPMYTLTARKGNPDRLELRYAETDTQVTLAQTPLEPFRDAWVEVNERINYGDSGSYELEIKKVSDQTILFSYIEDDIVNWRPGAEFVRPKWGIYRSLINDQDLRDEAVLFANFKIEEMNTLSVDEDQERLNDVQIFPNPVNDLLYLKNLPFNTTAVKVRNGLGTVLIENTVRDSSYSIDISALPAGTYFLSIFNESAVRTVRFIIY